MKRKSLLAIGTMLYLPIAVHGAVLMESSKFGISFDDITKAPTVITDKANNDAQSVSVSEVFSIVINKGAGDITVASSGSTISSALQSANKYTVTYTSASNGTTTVEYSLGASDHFMLKKIRFAPSFSGGYTIKRVKTIVFTASGTATRVVHQHGDGDYSYFLRKANNGFFFGVQVVPGIPISTNAANPIELQYDANIKLIGGSAYDAELTFIGCYTRTGHAYSTGLSSLHRCPTSPTGLDDGEAEAVLTMVGRQAPNRHVAPITVHFNGWQAGITITESSYADQGFKNTLITARDSLFGPGYYFSSAYPWFGHKGRMPGLTPSDTVVPYNQANERDFITWLHNNSIKSLLWISTAHASINPAEPRYCQNYDIFRLPGNDENCIADDSFMTWLEKITINEIKKGHEAFSHDEEGASNNYTTYSCSATNHSHIAGANVSYGCFYERKKLWKLIRATFGEDFELWNNRQEADTGPWEWLDLTTVCTYGENADWNNSPAKVRTCARGRHFYHFCPSWMHQVILYPNQSGSDPDKLMLSALAVSSSYLFGDGINVPGRSRIKYWIDWARSHANYMKIQSKYLPKWPAEGADGYMRIYDGNGYAFIFNDYGSTQSITLPLDASAGLDAANSYTFAQVFPVATGTSIAKGTKSISLNAGEYRLYSITPIGSKIIKESNAGVANPTVSIIQNPSTNSVVVKLSGTDLVHDWNAAIYSLDGRLVASKNTINKAGSNQTIWNAGKLPMGKYTVKCSIGNRELTPEKISLK